MIGGADDKLELFEGNGIATAKQGKLFYFTLDQRKLEYAQIKNI